MDEVEGRDGFVGTGRKVVLVSVGGRGGICGSWSLRKELRWDEM